MQSSRIDDHSELLQIVRVAQLMQRERMFDGCLLARDVHRAVNRPLNGMIMATKALLTQTPHPTPEQVKQGLDGYLCRCGTHTRILHAVLRAAKA